MRWLVPLLALAASACTTPSEEQEDLPPVSDQAHPLTALADFVLADYMASELHDGTITCVATDDGREAVALEFEQEARLMARHISLAPFTACGLIDGKWSYVEGGLPPEPTASHVIQVHGMSCADSSHCTGFVRQARWDVEGPDERFNMTFADGAWTIIWRGPIR